MAYYIQLMLSFLVYTSHITLTKELNSIFSMDLYGYDMGKWGGLKIESY